MKLRLPSPKNSPKARQLRIPLVENSRPQPPPSFPPNPPSLRWRFQRGGVRIRPQPPSAAAPQDIDAAVQVLHEIVEMEVWCLGASCSASTGWKLVSQMRRLHRFLQVSFGFPSTRLPSSALLPFFGWEDSPAKIDYRKKGYPYSNRSTGELSQPAESGCPQKAHPEMQNSTCDRNGTRADPECRRVEGSFVRSLRVWGFGEQSGGCADLGVGCFGSSVPLGGV